METKLDDWQKKVLKTDGNLCLRSGRQVGKSFIISIKAAEYAIKHPKKNIMMISAVERQAQLLFEKTLNYLLDNYPKYIKKGKDKPTKHKILLNNGSVINCLPTGLTGYGIRGYTVDLLIADEAAFIPEEVWTAVTPMLAITRGNIILLSTPHGREGYFYRCFGDPNFKTFHVSSEECPRKNDEFLAREKERMTRLQYAQEYLGEFIDELRQFFPNHLIKECCVLKRRKDRLPRTDYFLGVDVARMGNDESTFEILDITYRNQIQQVENLITKKTMTTETTRQVLMLEDLYKFNKIYIDDGGLGVGVFDQLLEEEKTRRKVVPINNARRSLDRADNPKKKKLMKEDLYNNLLRLMERREIKLLEDDEIILSLRSIQFEYTVEGNLKLFGNYSHIAEGLIRAAWGVKDKTLNIYVY